MRAQLVLLNGVFDGLNTDLTVVKDECIDSVVDVTAFAACLPFQVQHVVGEDGVKVPCRLRHILQELGEDGPCAVFAPVDLALHHKDGVVGVIGDDIFEVLGTQGLPVVREHFLGTAHCCHGYPRRIRMLTLILHVCGGRGSDID